MRSDRTSWDRRRSLGLVLLSTLWMTAVVLSQQRHHGLLAAVGIVFLLLGSTRTAWLNPSSAGISRSLHLLAVALPFTLVWGLYYPVTEGGWMHDDPRLVQAAAEHGLLAYFYDPAVLRTWTTSQLTPWLTFSLGVDLEVLGLRPFGFYLHQLLSLSLVVLLGYRLLCWFFPVVISSVIASLFVVSVPIATVVQFLAMRHYLDGLLLLCAAVLLYLRALRTNQFWWACIGALFYLLAGSAKEIYVPWVLLLPFLTICGPWRRQIRMAIPYLAVMGGYVLWRAYMLGPQHLLSQYGDIHGAPSWNDLINLPVSIAEYWGWTSHWPWVFLLVLISPWVVSLFKSDAPLTTARFGLESPRLRRWMRSIVLVVVVGVGLIPVLMILRPRYLMLPTLAFSLLLGAGLNEAARMLDRRWIRQVLVGLGLCLLLVNVRAVERSPVWKDRESIQAYRVLADFVLRDGDPNSLLISSRGSGLYYGSLSWLRTRYLGAGASPKVCSDLCVCLEDTIPRAYAYRDGSIQEIDLTTAKQQSDCGRAMAPLSINVVYSPRLYTLDWKFGPYSQGQYFYAGPSGNDEVSGHFTPIPLKGRVPFALSQPLTFVVKYVSEQGWHTYSAQLTVHPDQIGEDGKAELRWER